MNITIFLICIIFCSIQNLMKDENNITVINKRKCINEQDTTLSNNLINTNIEYSNAQLLIKKQKYMDNQLKNNNNYEDFNYSKNLNDSVNLECNDLIDVSTVKFNNKNVESEYSSCDDTNNFEKIFNIDDVCNNEDFIYYCNQFSLELLNNLNTEICGEGIQNKKQYSLTQNLNLDEKNNDIVDTSFLIKNSFDNIKIFSSSVHFTKIFDIIFNNLLNLLKICKLFFNIDNEQIKNYIINLEQQKNYEQKISTLIEVTSKMLNKNLNIYYTPNKDKFEFIRSIIQDKYIKLLPSTTFFYKLRRNRAILINEIKKNKITYMDILDCTIENLKFITDNDIRTICILGLKNILDFSINKPYQNLLNLGIVLYAFNNEKKYFNINWKENLIDILLSSKKIINKFNFFKKICNDIYNNNDSFLDYKLYIALNSLEIVYNLDIYNKICNDTSQLEFIHNLIDAVNKIKCRMLNIQNLNKIEKL